jgi:hypothetical protein
MRIAEANAVERVEALCGEHPGFPAALGLAATFQHLE